MRVKTTHPLYRVVLRGQPTQVLEKDRIDVCLDVTLTPVTVVRGVVYQYFFTQKVTE